MAAVCALAVTVPTLCACDQADPSDPVVGGDGDGDGDGDGGSGMGGDGDGDGDGPLPVSEQIYPLVPGSSWVFAHTGGSADWNENVTLNEETRDGKQVLVLKDTAGPSGSRSESVIAAIGTGAYRVHKRELIGETLNLTAEYDPGFVRCDQAWASAAPGTVSTLTYMRREWDGAGQLTRDGMRAHIFTVEATDETVTVPAGEFTDCVRVHRVRDRGVGEPLAEDDDKRFWFCPGIGKVREQSDIDGKTEELVECQVPGGACP